MDMAEDGRQQRETGLHIAAVVIPADEGSDGEAMPVMRNSA
jgi:hypothetical protein